MRYYFGEGSCHDLGFGVAPVNLYDAIWRVREHFKGLKIGDERYLIDGVIIDLYSKKRPQSMPEFWEEEGCLGLKLIGTKPRKIKKVSQSLKLPFHKNALRDI